MGMIEQRVKAVVSREVKRAAFLLKVEEEAKVKRDRVKYPTPAAADYEMQLRKIEKKSAMALTTMAEREVIHKIVSALGKDPILAKRWIEVHGNDLTTALEKAEEFKASVAELGVAMQDAYKVVAGVKVEKAGQRDEKAMHELAKKAVVGAELQKDIQRVMSINPSDPSQAEKEKVARIARLIDG